MANTNLTILAQVDAGKTNLTERIHVATGAVASVVGAAEETARTDTLALRPARGSACAVVPLGPNRLNAVLIDTVRYSDFVAEVARSDRAADLQMLCVGNKNTFDRCDACTAPRSFACTRFGH